MSDKTRKTYLYLYILGQKNNRDTISTMVPYRINDEELFFGPCKKLIREEIRELFPIRDPIDLEKENIDIYFVGINPAKDKKEEKIPRKFLFAGKIKKIFTFKYAWKSYNEKQKYNQKIVEMIKGKQNVGPLHLEPKYDTQTDIFIGYKHRTNEHKDSWLKDILSQNEFNQLSKEQIEDIYKNEEIFLENNLKFERDCCFEVENIFFSFKNHICPIEIDETFINLIKERQKELNQTDRLITHGGPKIYAPFGYQKNGDRFGRGYHLRFEGNDAEKFISEIRERTPKIFIANVGVNTSYGLKSPLFDDGSFEFIPIKEGKGIEGSHILTYDNLKCFNSEDKLIKYFPKNVQEKYKTYRVHNDPEFVSFTYGDVIDPSKPKSSKLSLIKKGDYLFFIANLTKYQNGEYIRYSREFYFIGFFEVEDAFSTEEEIKLNFKMIENNSHYRRLLDNFSDFGEFRIIKGNEKNSRRFKYAFKVTKEFCDACLRKVDGEKFNWGKFPSITGCIGSTTRAIRPYINKAKQPFLWQTFWNWINSKANKKIYKIDSVTSIFEEIVNSAVNNVEKSDEILIDTFSRLKENMKEWKGKAPLMTGIIELLYFEYIKRYIQKKLGINNYNRYQSGDPKSPVYLFKARYNSNTIILSSDIQIGEKNHIKLKLRHPETDETIKIQPDIFIGLEDKDSKIIPIAFIEIKLYTDVKKFRNSVFKRFKDLKESLELYYPTNIPYFIVLNIEAYKSKQFDSEFDDFQKIFDQFLYMKRDWDPSMWDKDKKAWKTPIKGQKIHQISDKIVALIKERTIE